MECLYFTAGQYGHHYGYVCTNYKLVVCLLDASLPSLVIKILFEDSAIF